MAEADLVAHQQRHPAAFRDVNKFLEKVEEAGKKFKENYTFTDELRKARDLTNTLFSRVRDLEKDKSEFLLTLGTDLKNLEEAIKGAEWMEDSERKTALDTLSRIEERLRCPLTEKGKGGPVEMSDATRITLQMNTAETLAKMAEKVQALESMNMISLENFRGWLALFFGKLKHEFGNSTYTQMIERDGAKVVRTILEGVGSAMQQSGEPRRGI